MSVLTPDASGDWNYTLSAPDEGAYLFAASAADVLGNMSQRTPDLEIYVDHTPPADAPVVTAPTRQALALAEVVVAGSIEDDADRVQVKDSDGVVLATLPAATGT